MSQQPQPLTEQQVLAHIEQLITEAHLKVQQAQVYAGFYQLNSRHPILNRDINDSASVLKETLWFYLPSPVEDEENSTVTNDEPSNPF